MSANGLVEPHVHDGAPSRKRDAWLLAFVAEIPLHGICDRLEAMQRVHALRADEMAAERGSHSPRARRRRLLNSLASRR